MYGKLFTEQCSGSKRISERERILIKNENRRKEIGIKDQVMKVRRFNTAFEMAISKLKELLKKLGISAHILDPSLVGTNSNFPWKDQKQHW